MSEPIKINVSGSLVHIGTTMFAATLAAELGAELVQTETPPDILPGMIQVAKSKFFGRPNTKEVRFYIALNNPLSDEKKRDFQGAWIIIEILGGDPRTRDIAKYRTLRLLMEIGIPVPYLSQKYWKVPVIKEKLINVSVVDCGALPWPANHNEFNRRIESIRSYPAKGQWYWFNIDEPLERAIVGGPGVTKYTDRIGLRWSTRVSFPDGLSSDIYLATLDGQWGIFLCRNEGTKYAAVFDREHIYKLMRHCQSTNGGDSTRTLHPLDTPMSFIDELLSLVVLEPLE